MFDIGWSELLVIAIVALVVIGPKDLPQAFRIAGRWMARARGLAREFQGHVDELMREVQVDEMKREFRDMTRMPELDGLESELMSGMPPDRPDLKPAAPAVSAPVTGAAVTGGAAAAKPVVQSETPTETIPPPP